MSYNLRALRILVIDDNMPIRMLIRSLLLDLGVGSVDIAANGQEGLEKYDLTKPDIILVDWRMDKMDGIAFTKAIRKYPTLHAKHIPIIMMTGFTNKQRVFLARDAGITEFLIKPFTVQALAKHLTHVIEHPRDIIDAPKFLGPDRRRRKDEIDAESSKRKVDRKKREPEKVQASSARLPIRNTVAPVVKKPEHAPEHVSVDAEGRPVKNKNYLDLRGGVFKDGKQEK